MIQFLIKKLIPDNRDIHNTEVRKNYGVLGGILGIVCNCFLFLLKLFTGASIGTRPMFFGGFFFVIAGIQMVTTGVLAELLTRVYFESGQSQAYVARDSAALDDSQGWRTGDDK